MAKPVRPVPEIVARVRALVERTSLSVAGRRLRIADATVARLAGGLPVTEGTAMIVAQRLPAAEEPAA